MVIKMSNMSGDSLERSAKIKSVTTGGLIANLIMSGLKFVVGYFGGSKALVADAAHSLSDAASDIGVLVGLRFWSKPEDASHPYGHGKIETFTGLIISAVLALTAIGIIWDALYQVDKSDVENPGAISFWVAVASIIVKEILFRWTLKVGKEVRSQTVIANAWHHRSDALSSVVAAVSIAVTYLFPSYGFVDDIGAVVVAVILLKAAVGIAFPALGKLTDCAPPPEIRDAIYQAAAAYDKVRSAHAIRTRYIGEDIFVDLHIEVDPWLSVREGHDISSDVSRKICEKIESVVDVVVHIEPHE